jgi:DNA repair photolyase
MNDKPGFVPPRILPPQVSPLLPNGFRGRGASANLPNRFESRWHEPDEEWIHADDPAPTTEFLPDDSRSVVATNDSPDIGFDASVNPYRGCEHGCIYCYARPTHEYLGMSAGLDFESRILVKYDAPALLRATLARKSWKPQLVMMSGVTDCYQPVERRLKLTRGCLEVLAEFRNPVAMITKNHLVTRDIDVLKPLADLGAAAVTLSVTTLDQDLSRVLEPRASVPKARLAAIRMLADAGIPVGVNVAPIIPGLTDHELPKILEAAAAAGATRAGYTILRLPHGVLPLFERWLDEHAPSKKAMVLHRLEALRGGARNDPEFGSRMRGTGIFAKHLADVFAMGCRRHRLNQGPPGTDSRYAGLDARHFRVPGPRQMSLFDAPETPT